MAELFTMNDSLENILQSERVNKKLNYLFSDIYYKNIRKTFRKMKLKHMTKLVKTPWGTPFPAQGLLDCANLLAERRQNGQMTTISIWKGLEGAEADAAESVILVPFLLDEKNREKKQYPTVLICPGGSYNRVAFHREGIPIAKALNEMGYQAFILNYRVDPHHYPVPQMDLIRAIRFIRANSEKLNVDPNRLTLMGFSAGGHLCGSVGALHHTIEDPTHRYDDIDARPNNICLAYPVVSFTSDIHTESLINHLGAVVGQDLKKQLSLELLMSKDYPKTYLWACKDDPVVPVSHTEMLGAAMANKGTEHKIELFDMGGHGAGLGTGTLADGWIQAAMKYLSEP